MKTAKDRNTTERGGVNTYKTAGSSLVEVGHFPLLTTAPLGARPSPVAWQKALSLIPHAHFEVLAFTVDPC